MSLYLNKDIEFIIRNLNTNKIEINSWYAIGVDHETENEWRTRRIALTIRKGYNCFLFYYSDVVKNI